MCFLIVFIFFFLLQQLRKYTSKYTGMFGALCTVLIRWLAAVVVSSRGKSSPPLAEFAQLPTTTTNKLSGAQLPYCFDETIIEHGSSAAAADVVPRTCALYACHLADHQQQPQRMRAPAQFLCDADFAMWRRRRRVCVVVASSANFQLRRSTTQHRLITAKGQIYKISYDNLAGIVR